MKALFKKFNLWAASKWTGAKTRVFNGLVIATTATGLVLNMFQVIDIRQYIDTKIAGYIILAVTVANYWLRYITQLEHKEEVKDLKAEIKELK